MHPGTILLALAAPARAQPATVSVFGARCDGVADDSPALAKAADALRDTGQVIQVPGGCRLRLAGTTLASSPEARPTAQKEPQGIVVAGTPATALSGLVLSNWAVPVVFNTTEGRHTVTGTTSTDSPPNNPNAAILGPGAARVLQARNNWDQGP